MQTQEQLVSQAYLANLAETYIEKVEVDKKYEPLIHAFQSFPALKNQFENLLKEVFHPFFIAKRLRNMVFLLLMTLGSNFSSA